MSLITNAQQSSSTGASTSAIPGIAGNGEVSQLFTTLLVAQIKNQNPLEPSDPSEFVGQMTQLSQMEALQKLATQGSGNGAVLESLQVIALGGQVGSEVMAVTDAIALDGAPVSGRFTLADGTADVALVVENSAGQQQRIAFGARNAGDVSFTIDPQALGLPAGTYSVRVEGAGANAPAVEVAGTLRNVRLSSSGVVLNVANIGQLTPEALTAFNGSSHAG